MTESLRLRFDFASPVIQLQTVKYLIAAVLKEKGPSGQITSSTLQGPALQSLWEQCCSDSAVIHSACCDAVVLLVAQGHADLQFVLNNVLNLLPSARNVQGLMKIIGQLLQIETDQRDRSVNFTCPYSIRKNPHPFITALESRVDCWPALTLEIDDFIQQAVDRRDPAYMDVLAPFLQYLYCEPQRQTQHALLRHSLLKVLLPSPPRTGSALKDKDHEQNCSVSDGLLSRLCQMVPYMQVDNMEAVLELCEFVAALLQTLLAFEERWRKERAELLLQMLCVSHRCLVINGDCRPLLSLMQQLLPHCRHDLPLDELMVGVALLLLEAPSGQQSRLLSLALSLVPEDAELSPWLSPILVLPLLQLLSCSSLTEPLAEKRTHQLNLDLAHRLLRQISKGTDKRQSCPPPMRLLSSWYSELRVALSTLRKVADNPGAAAEWLLSVSSALSSSQPRLCSLSLIVTHLILTGEEQICRLALKVVQAIATADPSQVPSLIPVLLYKLGRTNDPSVVHAVLYCLPGLGTHKLCISMVLQTLSMLASAPKMSAVAMRLLTALWKIQDRIYPELQVLLGQDRKVVVGRDAQWEQTLARAVCIRDICRERPYQHGGDMLAAITSMLNQCTSADMAVPAAVALHGLKELCSAEVVDILSTWKSLGLQLRTDSRTPLVKATAEILALVPQLTVKTEEYEKLKEEVVSVLWTDALSKDPEVAACGYKALAAFPQELHTINHLPEAVRPLPNLSEHGEDEQEMEEPDLSIAGPTYMRLMEHTPPPVLPAFELFLTALVKEEMSQMPRGVHFMAMRGGSLASARGKTVAGIPAFMLKTYEKNKQPGLKSGLTAGLLLCYELPLQTDREGRPINRLLVNRSHAYQQILANLIHDVNIQPSEWHRALLLPQAWSGFMSRAFNAALQGRRADLELRHKQGKDDSEELHYKQHCAWLWARDQLADIIKSAIKDSPVVQGNSILALSGLAAAVAKYGSNLPANGEDSHGAAAEFVPTADWLAMVLNTLLSISSSNYKATGPVFQWFLHRSYSGENTASVIARSCASLALSLLVPFLAAWRKDSLLEILPVLQAGLPGSPTAEDSQAIQFHSGLALGMVVSGAHHQHLSGVSAHQDAALLLDSLDALEKCSFRADLEYRTGCLLGLALVLVALCDMEQTDLHVRVTQTLDKLVSNLQDGGQGRMIQEVLAYSVACVTVSAFSRGLLDASKAAEVMNTLRNLTEESQQTTGFSLALGMVVHGLSMCGHGKAEDIHPHLLASWMKILLAEGCPTMHRLAAVSGLVALVGSESCIIHLKSELEISSQQQSRLNEVIRAVTQVITLSGAIGLQSNSACLLGHLYLAHMSNSYSHSSVPQDFSYLPEKSVIRSVATFLTEAGKKGPDFVHPVLVKTAVTSLASVGAGFQFPPVNWSVSLSPLMRLGFGEDVQHQCLVLAASQAHSSQSAALFLGSWVSPPLVHSLSHPTRAHLYESLGLWMKHVAEDKLQVYVDKLGLQHFQDKQNPHSLSMCQSLLRGLAQAMALPNPPKHCWTVLSSTTEKIYSILPNQIQDNEVGLYVGLAKCLSELCDTEIDRITRVTEDRMEKAAFILAYLTSKARLPFLGLNDVISGIRCGWPGHRVGWILLQAFYQCHRGTNPSTGVSQQMEWLLELMGHIRNIAYGGKAEPSGDTSAATDFLFHVFAAAVVSWGDHVVPLLLGVRATWLPWQPESKPQILEHSLYGEESHVGNALPHCLLGMPLSLAQLLSKEPWSSQRHKFIDWLLSITEGPEKSFSVAVTNAAKAALLALNSFPEFKKKLVWTRAYGW
ncbi:focadhesin [Takifugu flavidus]|uniref:focadhesin n=1 Tax=Takifugu flavidus TaxID=433684 RepID=UPI00254415BC|nr:focadhesin [Takifugu flavidus]